MTPLSPLLLSFDIMQVTLSRKMVVLIITIVYLCTNHHIDDHGCTTVELEDRSDDTENLMVLLVAYNYYYLNNNRITPTFKCDNDLSYYIVTSCHEIGSVLHYANSSSIDNDDFVDW